jgi:hypothetical protein
MADATAEFFEELGRREYEPLLASASGTLRFDIGNGAKTERWHVTMRKGAIAVTRRNDGADCVVGAKKALFDRIAHGEANAMAALLRGEVTVEGDPHVLTSFQRLFPGPPRRRRRRAAPAGRKR